MKKYDYLIVGAGLFGVTFAYIAKKHGKRCLVIDKRSHIGGNVYCEEIDGIKVHKYGPHIFHTNDEQVWSFVNQFVTFNRFTLNTIAYNNGRLYNLPFNMHTFYQMWGVINAEEAKRIIQRQRTIANITSPSNLEEQAISLVGRDIYETLIKGYSEKQWGRPCRELPAEIIKRLPVRYVFNNNYFNDKYQGVPDKGYNELVERMLTGIDYRLNSNYLEDRYIYDNMAEKIVYTGPIDEFFDFELGHLEYRSLRFENEKKQIQSFQGNAIVNYTGIKEPYTRIVEHKFFDIGNENALNAPYTIITREYPAHYANDVEPYYPINNIENNEKYKDYQEFAKQTRKNVMFAGRLGAYKYLDMDKSIKMALDLESTIQ